jgi:hypothetical protein
MNGPNVPLIGVFELDKMLIEQTYYEPEINIGSLFPLKGLPLKKWMSPSLAGGGIEKGG